jgi:hypothetical protein
MACHSTCAHHGHPDAQRLDSKHCQQGIARLIVATHAVVWCSALIVVNPPHWYSCFVKLGESILWRRPLHRMSVMEQLLPRTDLCTRYVEMASRSLKHSSKTANALLIRANPVAWSMQSVT